MTGLRSAAGAGVAAVAAAILLLAVPWPRAAALGLAVAAAVLVARRIPVAERPSAADLDEEPQSSGFHPVTLLADALSRAARDPADLRRVRPRLAALARDLLALRGTTVAEALAAGTFDARTAQFLGLDDGPVATPGGGRQPADVADLLRRSVTGLAALAGTSQRTAATTATDTPEEDR